MADERIAKFLNRMDEVASGIRFNPLKTFASKEEAESHLRDHGFHHVGTTADIWHRLSAGVNSRYSVGQCRTGQWLITKT